MSKKVIISGGSGFLGSRLSEVLLTNGFSVVSLDMQPPQVAGVSYVEANILKPLPQHELLREPYAVVNLAGKNIFGRWTEEHKRLIYDTRVAGTRNLIALFQHARFRPQVLVSASAVGAYGDRGGELLTEESSWGDDFLARVVRDWEDAAQEATAHGVRVVCIRNGHILGSTGGMVPVLAPYYRWGVGGSLGMGDQFFPWVHIDDCVALYLRAITTHSMQPIRNAVAGNPITNREFSRSFARAMRRPHVFKIPKWALRFRYGEFADAMTSSQRVTSLYTRNFRFTDIESALQDVLKDKKK